MWRAAALGVTVSNGHTVHAVSDLSQVVPAKQVAVLIAFSLGDCQLLELDSPNMPGLALAVDIGFVTLVQVIVFDLRLREVCKDHGNIRRDFHLVGIVI